MKIDLVFDPSARNFVLEAFGKIIDAEGYLVERDKPSQRVLTRDGQEIRCEEFAGVLKGSEIYLKSDLVSLIDLCDSLRRKGQRRGVARKS